MTVLTTKVGQTKNMLLKTRIATIDPRSVISDLNILKHLQRYLNVCVKPIEAILPTQQAVGKNDILLIYHNFSVVPNYNLGNQGIANLRKVTLTQTHSKY